MERTKHQFIVDFASKNDVQLPNSFLDKAFPEYLEKIGYELPPSEVYERYVKALNERYPSRYIVPFGKSLDSDDTVGFVVKDQHNGGPIVEIHDFASEGWESPQYFESLTSWLQARQLNLS